MDRQWQRDGATQDSGSVLSGFDSMDDDTDEFGRMIIQHARDEQRMNQVLQRTRQPFRKARPAPRISDALDVLEGQVTRGGRDSPQEHLDERRAPSAGSSNDSEPPLNVPKEWGRKGRHSNGWLRRMREQEIEAQTFKKEESILPHKTAYTGDNGFDADWRVAGNRASPSSLRKVRQSSSPEAKPKTNLSSDRLATWEAEQDFTAASLLESTPAVPSRTRPIDDLRRREIESIEKQAITTSRLDRFSEVTAAERVRRTLSGRLSNNINDEAGPAISPESRRSRRSVGGDKENVPQSDGNQPALKGLGPVAAGSDSIQPRRTTTDPQALLRRLARASSKSPSPSPGPAIMATEKVRFASDTEHRQRSASAYAPEAIMIEDKPVALLEATPAPDCNRVQARTPSLAGAWVDTPNPRSTNIVIEAHPPSPRPQELSPQIPIHRTQSEPAPLRPTSALTDLLSTARTTQSSGLGDDTIASLEDLLDPTLRLPPATSPLDLFPTRQDPSRPATKADQARATELNAITGMDAKLRAASSSIRDAGANLRNVEKGLNRAVVTKSTTITFNDNNNNNNNTNECQACKQGSVSRALFYEMASLFITPKSRKLTPLSWMLVAFSLWWMLETLACARYCQPMYATRMVGYGVDVNAPRWPFVIPTLVLRPFRFVLWPLAALGQWLSAALGTGMGPQRGGDVPASGVWVLSSDAGRSGGRKVIGSQRIVREDKRWFGGGSGSWFRSMFGKGLDSVTWRRSDERSSASESWSEPVGHVVKGNVWSKGQYEWEAGDVDIGTMSEDEFV